MNGRVGRGLKRMGFWQGIHGYPYLIERATINTWFIQKIMSATKESIV